MLCCKLAYCLLVAILLRRASSFAPAHTCFVLATCGMPPGLPPARTIVHRCPPTPITVVGLLGRWSPGTTTWGDRRLDRGSGHVVVGAHGCVESWRGEESTYDGGGCEEEVHGGLEAMMIGLLRC